MRNVIVTGASRGLGLGIARRLAAEGYRVIGIARNRSRESQDAEAEAFGTGSLVFISFNLGEVENIPDLIAGVRKEHGPVWGLVNNAGISFEGALAMMPVSQIEQLIRINMLSPIVLTKSVVRGMLSDGGGSIVNVSSVTASTGYSGLSVYSATKSSLIGFSRSLAREVGRAGIRINCVAPGFIDTQMTQKLDAEQKERIVRRSALQRLAEIDDVANAVEFLLSDKAKNITGTVLTVDAGNTA